MTDDYNNHDDRFEGLPESWSDSARETYVQVEEDLGEPDSATLVGGREKMNGDGHGAERWRT